MPNRKPEEFQKQAKLLNLTKWNMHNCSLCGYKCCFIWDDEHVYYDSGCYCFRVEWTKVSWEDVADHYNIQNHKNVIREYDQFWGFKST